MKSSLLAHKVDLAVFIEPFLEDPDLHAKAHALFSSSDAMGPVRLTFWTAREGYLEQHRAAVVDLLEDYGRALRWAWDPAHREEAIGRAATATKQSADLLGRYIFTHQGQLSGSRRQAGPCGYCLEHPCPARARSHQGGRRRDALRGLQSRRRGGCVDWRGKIAHYLAYRNLGQIYG
jgi:hypothetical protein